MPANEAAWKALDALAGAEGPEADRLRSEAVGEQPVPNETDKVKKEVEVKAEEETEAKAAELLDKRGAKSPMALMPVSSASRKRPAED